jgi:N-acyl-D-aspartate/D-glutamate deacylase
VNPGSLKSPSVGQGVVQTVVLGSCALALVPASASASTQPTCICPTFLIVFSISVGDILVS